MEEIACVLLGNPNLQQLCLKVCYCRSKLRRPRVYQVGTSSIRRSTILGIGGC